MSKKKKASLKKSLVEPRRYSSQILDGKERAASRGMLYGVGFKKADFKKPQVGVASTWAQVTPCNVHIDGLAREAAKGVDDNGGKAIIFNTITISDGISMGTEGMKYSLVSREVIADSVETVVSCQGYDGVLAIGGCDKNMPGLMIALSRLNRPSIFVYGGTILPGRVTLKGKQKDADIVSIFEAVGANACGKMSDMELEEVESKAIAGAGSCGGMYTANTMATAIEAMGMSLPNSSAYAAVSAEKSVDCRSAGAALMHLIKKGICPKDIMTKKAFENAITLSMALGGSTNVVLHLLAMAHAIGVKLKIDDFNRLGKRVPLIGDFRPSGKYAMNDLAKIGGVSPVMRLLLDKGLLHGECLTSTGKTLAENLVDVKPYGLEQDVIRPLEAPIKKDGHLVILYGNLAPQGAVAKISGKEGLSFRGKARVFHSEEKALERILDGSVKKGDVIVIRYEGPKGGPGMREMLAPTSAIMGRGLGNDVALITDGRFSGGSHGFVIGHITPEAHEGGPLALVKNGDRISIDIQKKEINLDVSKKNLRKRLNHWKQPKPKYKRGVLAKYVTTVSSATLGAVTDKKLKF